MSRKQEAVNGGKDSLHLFNVDEGSSTYDNVQFLVEGEVMWIKVDVGGRVQMTAINKDGAQGLRKWLKDAIECFEESK
jgi:hypothetical protein